MADVTVEEIVQRVLKEQAERDLVAAAACVANSIRIGLGVMIVNTMMEADLRRALCLNPGEMVNFPRHSSAPAERSDGQ